MDQTSLQSLLSRKPQSQAILPMSRPKKIFLAHAVGRSRLFDGKHLLTTRPIVGTGERKPWQKSPGDHTKAPKPVPLNLVFPPIRAEVKRAIEATNALLALLQQYHEAPSDGSSLSMSETELREKLLSQRTAIISVGHHYVLHVRRLIRTSVPGSGDCCRAHYQRSRLCL